MVRPRDRPVASDQLSSSQRSTRPLRAGARARRRQHLAASARGRPSSCRGRSRIHGVGRTWGLVPSYLGERL